MTKKTYLEPNTEIITVVNEQMLASLSLGDKTYSTTEGDGHGGGTDLYIDNLDNPTTPNAPIMLWEEIGNIEDKGRRIAFFE